MSFLLALLEYRYAILFYLIVFFIVYVNRKKFDVQGGFIFLYRTKIGIKFMGWVASRARKTVKVIGYIGAIAGFIGMAITFVLIFSSAYKLITGEAKTAASPVLPGLPIAGTGLVFPLITGWIVLFIIILIHESAHGIVASAYKIKVKNSGMAFFGPIFGAFVEPDENDLGKRKDMIQHSVFAAGPFSNFLTVLLVIAMTFLVINPVKNVLTPATGVTIFSQPGLPAELAGIRNNSIVTGINGRIVQTREDFKNAMEEVKPGDIIKLATANKTYNVRTIENPKEPSRSYLGVWVISERREPRYDTVFSSIAVSILGWLDRMFGWLAFLSLNIGLINLFPVFFTDGARMLKVLLDKIIKNKEKSMSIWAILNWASLLSLLTLVFLPFFRFLGTGLLSMIV